jgi:hypothetical protein
MKLRLSIGTLCAFLLLGFCSAVVAKAPPVAKLVQVEGKVDYSRNGVSWKKVRRTKYLFAGYRIKTGKDGSGKLISQQTGTSQELGPNSEIAVNGTEIDLITGSLSEPKSEAGSIFQGLSNKFAKAQRYTTVRRGNTSTDEPVCDSKVRTIKRLSLSAEYPELVWRNACPEYSYRLVIDGAATAVPAQATSEMIRFVVADVKSGNHAYRVEVLDNDGTVYIPKKDSEFTWLSKSDQRAINAQSKKLSDDVFELTDFLEQKGLFVVAMDAYRGYFAENPDDNDMRPLLIKSYSDLKLSDLKEGESRLFQASLEEDF